MHTPQQAGAEGNVKQVLEAPATRGSAAKSCSAATAGIELYAQTAQLYFV